MMLQVPGQTQWARHWVQVWCRLWINLCSDLDLEIPLDQPKRPSLGWQLFAILRQDIFLLSVPKNWLVGHKLMAESILKPSWAACLPDGGDFGVFNRGACGLRLRWINMLESLLDAQVQWILFYLSSECWARNLFCLPKGQDRNKKSYLCSIQLLFNHSSLCSPSDLCFFPNCCHHSPLTPFPSSAHNRFSLFCTGCSAEQWPVFNIYFHFPSGANKELKIAGRAQRFRTPSCSSWLLALLLCWGGAFQECRGDLVMLLNCSLLLKPIGR